MIESKSFNSSSIILYHGGNASIEIPEIRSARYTKDFGYGFYTTLINKQAEKWACRLKYNPIVSKYAYKENPKLNILRFETMTEDWLDFIIFCRQGKTHNYDIVEGPMADDTIYDFITDYINDIITRETFWSYAKFKYPTHQLSFHTDNALKCLKFIGSYR